MAGGEWLGEMETKYITETEKENREELRENRKRTARMRHSLPNYEHVARFILFGYNKNGNNYNHSNYLISTNRVG